MQWRHDVLYAAQTERVYCVQKQLHLSGCAASVSLSLFDEWLGFLSVARVELDAAVLSGHDHLCDILPDDVAAGDVGDFDFHLWTRIVLPTMSVHILGMEGSERGRPATRTTRHKTKARQEGGSPSRKSHSRPNQNSRPSNRCRPNQALVVGHIYL